MNISAAIRAAAGKGAISQTLTTFEGLQFGSKVAHGAVTKVTSTVRDNMKSAAEHSSRFSDSMDDSARSAGKLSSALSKVRANIKEYTQWAAVGALVGSAMRDLNRDVDSVVESYYSMGRGLEKTRKGFRALAKDAWNLAKMQGMLEDTAALMNLPADAAEKLGQKLTRSVRTFYGPGGKIRYDIAGDAARQVLAFSRITGASVDQSVDLYARLTNQFGRSHRQATQGMHTIARAGQLANEELQALGKEGGMFLEDLVGFVNDASQAFQGFTLNVEHLSARAAHAIKTGQELGMTYNQAADTAKQMTSIFAKPGGFMSFQGGERLRQEIVSITRGIDDAEQRAKALSQNFGINIAQGRTLDIASRGTNAQMGVMEILAGTSKGMETQFELMKEMAKNNALDLNVFKSFIGGENLTQEQSGDLLQVVLNQGDFRDFQRRLDTSKKETAADRVLEQSVLVPTMVMEWIKAESASSKMNLAFALGSIKAGIMGAVAVTLLPVLMGIFRAISKLPETFRNLRDLARNSFSWFPKMEAIGKYVMSGRLFDRVKSTFTSMSAGISQLVQMFRSGQASVQMRDGMRSLGSAGRTYANERYRNISERYNSAAAAARERMSRAASPEERQRWRSSYDNAMRTADAATNRLAQNYGPMISRGHEYAQNKLGDARNLTREQYQALRRSGGDDVAAYARQKGQQISAGARRTIDTVTASAKRVQTEAMREARRAEIQARWYARRRARMAVGGAAPIPGAPGGGFAGGASTAAGTAADIADNVGSMVPGPGGMMMSGVAALLDTASNMASVFSGGGNEGFGAGAESRAQSAREARLERAAKLRAKLRTPDGARKLGGLRGFFGGFNKAVAPAAGELARAGAAHQRATGTFTTDVIANVPKGIGAAARQKGFRNRAAAGLGTVLGGAGKMSAARFGMRAAAAAGAAATIYGTWSMFRQTVMGEEDVGENGEVAHAGTRKYGDKLAEQEEALTGLSEQIDIAQMSGDKETEALLRKEYEAQKGVLKDLQGKADGLDAVDRQIENYKSSIEQLKKARDNSKSDSFKKLADMKIDNLEGLMSKEQDKLESEGMTATFIKEARSKAAMALGSVQMVYGVVSQAWGHLMKFGWISKGVDALKRSAFYILKFMGKTAKSALVPSWAAKYIGKFLAPAAGFIGKSAAGLARLAGPVARFIPGLGELMTFGMTFANTEGSVGRRLFVSTAATAASGAARAATLGAAGLAGVGTGGVGAVALGAASAGISTGAAIAGQSGAEMIWDKWFGDGDSKVAPEPANPGGAMAGTNTENARAVATPVGTVRPDGTVHVVMHGFTGVVGQANFRNEQRNTGKSG